VNDGSQDRGGEICDAYAREYSHVEVIHQANHGLSAARNAGLEQAKGQWISFVDSDDYISIHFVEQMLNACIQHNADISVCRYITDYSGNLCENDFKKADEYELITGREAVIWHFGKGASILNMAACKMMCALLWKNLRFPLGKINEDLFVSHQLMYSARNIVITNAYNYAYYQSPGSIMRKPFTLKRLDGLDAWHEGVRFFEQADEPELLDIARRVYLNRLFDAYGLCKKFLPNERKIHKHLRRQAIEVYKIVRRTRSYVDMHPRRTFLYRIGQFIGRYFPMLYNILLLRKRMYI